MQAQTDRTDRRLVTMSTDHFAAEPAHQQWYNRDLVFMALIVLSVIGMTVYHFVFATP